MPSGTEQLQAPVLLQGGTVAQPPHRPSQHLDHAETCSPSCTERVHAPVQLQGGTVAQPPHRSEQHLGLSQTSIPPGKEIRPLQLHRLLLQLVRVQGEEQHRRQHPPRSTAPNQHEGGLFLRLSTAAARPCT